MSDLTINQIAILLSFYYFDSKKNDSKVIKKFSQKFNAYFKTDINEQLISYYCSLFKGIDPSFTAHPSRIEDPRFIDLWNYYIKDDRIDSLKREYLQFKNNVNQPLEKIVPDVDFNETIESSINDLTFTYKGDFPKQKYEIELNSASKKYRDVNVSFNALKIANFKCECNEQHITFIRKSNNLPYSEGHHIIPLKYQDRFDVNLDVEANVVSLCSNCHNKLHYGKDFAETLKVIFTDERRSRLKKCGIDISFEDLLEMYK